MIISPFFNASSSLAFCSISFCFRAIAPARILAFRALARSNFRSITAKDFADDACGKRIAIDVEQFGDFPRPCDQLRVRNLRRHNARVARISDLPPGVDSVGIGWQILRKLVVKVQAFQPVESHSVRVS